MNIHLRKFSEDIRESLINALKAKLKEMNEPKEGYEQL